jgi:hypothetical protein
MATSIMTLSISHTPPFGDTSDATDNVQRVVVAKVGNLNQIVDIRKARDNPTRGA